MFTAEKYVYGKGVFFVMHSGCNIIPHRNILTLMHVHSFIAVRLLIKYSPGVECCLEKLISMIKAFPKLVYVYDNICMQIRRFAIPHTN